MNYLSKYDIAFKGLNEGDHQFEFECDDTFFEKFENSEVKKGKIKVKVNLTKQSTLMILDFTVKGTVELMCDRCLDNYHEKVKNNNKLFIKFGNQTEEMSDDVIVVSTDEYHINTAQYIYELIILGLPIKHVHPFDKKGNSGCDPEMLNTLNKYLVEEDDFYKEEPQVDDRWSELKKLLDNK